MTKLNKRLLLILSGLVLLYVLARTFLAPGRESNTTSLTFHVDTTGVTEVALYPASEGHKEIRLVRQGGKWQAQYGAVRATPLPGSVEAMLGALANIPTQRLVSGKKDKWNEYKVGDTSGTRVIVYKGRDPICDYWIGEGASSSDACAGRPGNWDTRRTIHRRPDRKARP